MSATTRRYRVYGIVQGVGFRPTVARHATTARVTGTVANKGPYVEVYAQGTSVELDSFEGLLRTQPPRRAAILKLDVRPAPDAPTFADFSIIESEKTAGEIFISPDIAICEDCKRELYDPTDRRYLHPFINCTCCGPRLTILDSLPYDRVRTSMAEFPMCPTCAHEYHDPASRRYDAQPVCCNECGPEAYLLDRPERGRDAITEARRIIAAGGVVAVKGIGGFHLCCDATNSAAVGLLRERKRRSVKPFAVMVADLDVARRECHVSPLAEEILDGHQKPILLLPRRTASGQTREADPSKGQVSPLSTSNEPAPMPLVCDAVAPDNPKLGIMLPYAPLQLLLFSYPDGIEMPDCLVMTSANESGAPICRDDEDARRELAPLADAILSHDRLIRVRADDTVMDLFEEKPYMVRRSRGWAPLPFVLGKRLDARVLAVGGELKNAFCVGVGDLLYPSPYVGDLADVRTVDALRETIARFLALLETTPEVVACDLHPGYNSTVVARVLADELDVPLVQVQHHYAHVAACMAENDVEGPVVGVSFDGTGYGEDGTVWGGEIMLADARGYERLDHIAPFPQAGGDLAAREGWRVAVGMLGAFVGDGAQGNAQCHNGPAALAERLGLCAAAEARVVLAMIDWGINTVTSTSAGRLFDAVSAVLGIRRVSTFEGEAAIQLQFAAECGRSPELALPDFSQTDELFRWIVERRLAGDDPDLLAYAFHVGLASFVEARCIAAREQTGVNVVALTGGCYQNLLLLELSVERLRRRGFNVLNHSLLPPNDGGIAVGQALVAARMQCV